MIEGQIDALEIDNETMLSEMSAFDHTSSKSVKHHLKELESFSQRQITQSSIASNLVKDGGRLKPVSGTTVKTLTPQVNHLKSIPSGGMYNHSNSAYKSSNKLPPNQSANLSNTPQFTS